MKRHVIVFMLVAVCLYFVNTYETQLDKLMVPLPVTQSAQTGIKEVLFDTEQYEPETELVRDAYTILYFYSNSCPGCRRLNSDIRQFVQVRPDIAVRKFDLGYHWSGDNAYNTYRLRIGKTPFILIYGPDGSLIARDDGTGEEAFDLLYEWMNAELKQAWERRSG